MTVSSVHFGPPPLLLPLTVSSGCRLQVLLEKLGWDRNPPSSLLPDDEHPLPRRLDGPESPVNTNRPSADREMRARRRRGRWPLGRPSTQSWSSRSLNELERDGRATMFRTTLHPLLRLDIRVDLDLERQTKVFSVSPFKYIVYYIVYYCNNNNDIIYFSREVRSQ